MNTRMFIKEFGLQEFQFKVEYVRGNRNVTGGCSRIKNSYSEMKLEKYQVNKNQKTLNNFTFIQDMAQLLAWSFNLEEIQMDVYVRRYN